MRVDGVFSPESGRYRLSVIFAPVARRHQRNEDRNPLWHEHR